MVDPTTETWLAGIVKELDAKSRRKQVEADAAQRCKQLVTEYGDGARLLWAYYEHLSLADVPSHHNSTSISLLGEYDSAVTLYVLSDNVDDNLDIDTMHQHAHDYIFPSGCDLIRYRGWKHDKVVVVDLDDRRRTLTFERVKGRDEWKLDHRLV